MQVRQRKIGRRVSPAKMIAVPIVTVIIGSMLTTLPIISDYPILPPMGFLILLAWRLLHPSLWPVWIGAPLGFIDDIFSGQPMGSAIFLWSMVLLGLEILDRRNFSRDYLINWLLAAVAIALVLVGGMMVIHPTENWRYLDVLLPQFVLSTLLFPFIARLVAALDRYRLTA